MIRITCFILHNCIIKRVYLAEFAENVDIVDDIGFDNYSHNIPNESLKEQAKILIFFGLDRTKYFISYINFILN